MPRPSLLLVVFLFLLGGCAAPQGPETLAFVDVHVVPMDTERVLEHHTVLVREGQIVALGPADAVDVPAEAVRIEGNGRYLMPGLADMHVHLGQETDLTLLVANGVTTARLMWGSPEHLAWRARLEEGTLLGPRLYLSGPILEGTPPPELASVIPTDGKVLVDTAAAATAEVARQQEAGYDFIKVYNNLPADAYRGIVEEARRRGIPVAGHVPFEVGLQGAFEAGQASIEHLRGYIQELVPAEALLQPGSDLRSRTLAWQYADADRLDALAQTTQATGTWNCPTLTTRIFLLPQAAVDAYLARPQAQYLSADFKAIMQDRTRMGWLSNFSEDDFRQAVAGYRVQDALLRALQAAGANLLAGTDMQPWGFSLHRELENLVAAGLTPYQALVAATRNPAAFLGWAETSGTIAEGKWADLVLVDGNPLDDVTHAATPAGVALRGRWLPASNLQAMLEQLTP